MSTRTLDLRNLIGEVRDVALNEAVAIHVAGWTQPSELGIYSFPCWKSLDGGLQRRLPPYATSCDATTPLLIGRHWNAWTQSESLTGPISYHFGLYPKGKERGYAPSRAETEPLARCYALLRDAGWEVIT